MFELTGNHISLDIETLDKCPGGAIISIGAVVFNDQRATNTQFYKVISAKDNERCGMTTDVGTLAWWMNQSGQARDTLLMSLAGGAELGETLDELRQWIRWQGAQGIWTKGPAFDAAFIRVAEKRTGREDSWQFWLDRDVRTILYAANPVPREFEGVAHNALDDAIFQANQVIDCFKVLRAPMHIQFGEINPILVVDESEGAHAD